MTVRAMRLSEAALWILTAAFAVLAIVRGTAVVSFGDGMVQADAHALLPMDTLRSDVQEDAAWLADSNPFRVDRQMPLVRYGEEGPDSSAEDMSTVSVLSPVPLLLGTIGPPWQALVSLNDGMPGSRLVERGDTIAGYTVLVVQSGEIRIEVLDTTLVLTLPGCC